MSSTSKLRDLFELLSVTDPSLGVELHPNFNTSWSDLPVFSISLQPVYSQEPSGTFKHKTGTMPLVVMPQNLEPVLDHTISVRVSGTLT